MDNLEAVDLESPLSRTGRLLSVCFPSRIMVDQLSRVSRSLPPGALLEESRARLINGREKDS